MKKIILILGLVFVLVLGGCGCQNTSDGLLKGVVIGRHESASFNDVTYVIVELEDGQRVQSRGLSLFIGDNVVCKVSDFFQDRCFLDIR